MVGRRKTQFFVQIKSVHLVLELWSYDGSTSGQVMVSVVEGVVEDEDKKAEGDCLEDGREDGILISAPLVGNVVHTKIHSDRSLGLKETIKRKLYGNIILF